MSISKKEPIPMVDPIPPWILIRAVMIPGLESDPEYDFDTF